MKNINTNKPIQLQAALIPVCKMVIRFGLHFHEFVRNLQTAYIHAAGEILSQSKIKPNVQAIAIKTGMDRRTVSEHKNLSDKKYTTSLNKMDMLIVQLQLYSAKRINRQFSLQQLKAVIDSIYAQHIRSGAIVKELISNNIIKKVKNDKYKINLTLQQQLAEISMMADEVDYTAKRLFQTYYKNMFEANISDNNKLIQSTCLSTKIAPRYQEKVNELLKKELQDSENKIFNIIRQYESNVPDKTYSELGVCQFQFNF